MLRASSEQSLQHVLDVFFQLLATNRECTNNRLLSVGVGTTFPRVEPIVDFSREGKMLKFHFFTTRNQENNYF